MCGIGGILRTDGKPIPDEWLNAIDARIAYRGPDGHGRFRDSVEISTPQGKRTVEIAFVHRRLSIIDHEGGHQPMVSERGRNRNEGLIAVTFNGCIYNHREHRRTLESLGHRFTTDHSDTEVLIHGHREWGTSLQEHLEGMYAYAIWDQSHAAMLLGRDWFGEKPLYVTNIQSDDGEIIIFASDAQAVAQVANIASQRARVTTNPPPEWIARFLQFGYAWEGCTAFANGPSTGSVTCVPPSLPIEFNVLDQPRQDLESDFELLIDQSVQSRLEADVPLGCFLSGGIDSSLVAAFAKKHKPDLKTFCVQMPDVRFDESEFASAVAHHLKTDHTTLDVAVDPAIDLVKLIETLGQPFGDSSILPTYWVSKAARKHVKVALSGDGGDELFVGYDRYRIAPYLKFLQPVARLIPLLLTRGFHAKSFFTRLGRLKEVAADFSHSGLFALESIFTQKQIYELTGLSDSDSPQCNPQDNAVNALRFADVCHYLPGDLLTKVDTASMAAALEVRAPFLDRQLSDTALSTPTDLLTPNGKRKGLLRSIARRHLPNEIVDRRKMGFAVPIGDWFRTDYGDMRSILLDMLQSADPFGPIYIDRAVVRRLIHEHLACSHDHGQRLFSLLTLSIWAKSLGASMP